MTSNIILWLFFHFLLKKNPLYIMLIKNYLFSYLLSSCSEYNPRFIIVTDISFDVESGDKVRLRKCRSLSIIITEIAGVFNQYCADLQLAVKAINV